MRIILPRRPPFAEPVDVPGRKYLSFLSKAAGKLRVYWLAHRQARAAEEVLSHLRRMSDEDLARFGVTRTEIGRRVRESLEVKE